MANDINNIVIVGRLTKDPELRTAGQNSVCSLSIASGKTFMHNGEKKEKTGFFEAEAWGKLAEIISSYAKKGRQVCIQGSLEQQTWESPDGKKNYKIKIIASSVQLIGSHGNDDSGSTQYTDPEVSRGVATSQDAPSPEDIF